MQFEPIDFTKHAQEQAEEDYIVTPFTVIVDSREQYPFHFKGLKSNANKKKIPLLVDTKVKGLKTGDYTIEGYEDQISIERKSKPDAFGTFISDRERGMNQLKRLSELDHAYVVIECSLESLIHGPDRDELSTSARRKQGKSLFRSILAWQIDFPSVHWMFLSTRGLAETTTFRILEKFWDREVIKKRNKI